MRQVDLQEYEEERACVSAPRRYERDALRAASAVASGPSSRHRWYGGRMHPDARLHRRGCRGGRPVGAPSSRRSASRSFSRWCAMSTASSPRAGETNSTSSRGDRAARRAGPRPGLPCAAGVLPRTAARLPHRGGGAAHRARAHPVRRADTPQVWDPPAGRGALRRVHGRYSGEPAGEGGGCAAGRDAAALAGGPQGAGVDRRDAGQRLAGGVPAAQRAGGPASTG